MAHGTYAELIEIAAGGSRCDFIEKMHEKGEPFEQAIKDAGIERLRLVLITVGAPILALFPLASHGGPLWKPLCYAQIGGLAVATFITLLLVRGLARDEGLAGRGRPARVRGPTPQGWFGSDQTLSGTT